MESINERMKDLRYPYGEDRIQQQELAAALGIPVSTINEYEKEGTYVPSDVIIKYCRYFNVTSDYLLGLTDIRNQPNAEIHELHLTGRALEKLKNQEINPWLLSDIIEHDQFNSLMMDASIYVDGFLDENIYKFNTLMDLHRRKLLEDNSSSLEKEKTLALLTQVHIDQDNYFAHQLHERFKIILHDVRDKHRKDPDTSEYRPESYTAVYDDIANVVMNTKGSNAKKFMVLLRECFKAAFRIKNTNTNMKAISKLVTNNLDEEQTEALLAQSPLVEPDDRKRRKASRKLKDQ